ncbi:hypothetical protein M758_7G115900 [Ceratodon purpureus]|nr:hypothetical protein M758_7G115900 [Ceratodon purpureus]
MAHNVRVLTATLVVVVLAMCVSRTEAQSSGLAFDFYRTSCPEAEDTILRVMHQESQKDPAIRADILRLHFHDCFVRGCDASVLLKGKGTERVAPPNFRLEAFSVIDMIKEALEDACPETVSCADVLAFAARDGVALAGGPNWAVRGGRRDGLVSKASEAVANLPGTEMNVEQLTATFAKQGLTQDEMVTLSGAHTIGDSACVHIDTRIHGEVPDPILPQDYLDELKSTCPSPGRRVLPTVHFDRMTDSVFDTAYYENLKERKGLLTSDQVLFEDEVTRGKVLANTNQAVFFEDFQKAMLKMSEIDVLTGTNGEIRLMCKEINPAIRKPDEGKPGGYEGSGYGQPGTEAPGNETTAGEKPADENPAGEKPADEHPAGEEPADENPAGEKPADENPAGEKPADEHPAGEEPADENPAGEKPADENPAGEKPADENPAGEKPADEHPAGEEPADENPAGEKPADENPAGEKPADENPAGEKPADEKPAGEKPVGEKPKDEKPVEEKPKDAKPKDKKTDDEEADDEEADDEKPKDKKSDKEKKDDKKGKPAPSPPKKPAPSPPKKPAPSPPKKPAPSPPKKAAPSPPKKAAPSPPKKSAPSPPKKSAPSPPKKPAPSPPKKSAPSPPKKPAPSPSKKRKEKEKKKKEKSKSRKDDD